MNIPRKPPSVSPPVQGQPQPRGPPHYTVTAQPLFRHQLTGQEEISQIRFTPQQFSGYPQQGAVPHDMNKQAVPGTGPNPQQGMQTQVMYPHAPGQQPPPRQTTPSFLQSRPKYHSIDQGFVQPRQSIPQNIRATRQPMNVATSPGPAQQMYNTPPMQTTMFVPGQPPLSFNPGQHQVIIQQGPPPPMQVPAYNPTPRIQNQYAIATSQPGTYSMTPSPQPYYQPQQNSAVYYPTNPSATGYTIQPTPTIQQTTRTPGQQSYHSKREKKILSIVDPNTGNDIMSPLLASKSNSTPSSTPSSDRQTPVESTPTQVGMHNSNIAAQFAAQVAATLSPSSSRHSQLPVASPSTAPSQPPPTESKPHQEPPPPSQPQAATLTLKNQVAEVEVPSERESPPSVSEKQSTSEAVPVVPEVAVVKTAEVVVPPEGNSDNDVTDSANVQESNETVDAATPPVSEIIEEEVVAEKVTVEASPPPPSAGDAPAEVKEEVPEEISKPEERSPSPVPPPAPPADEVKSASVIVSDSMPALPEDKKALKEDLNRVEKVAESQRLRQETPNRDVTPLDYPAEEKKDTGKENERPAKVAEVAVPAPPSREENESKEPKKRNRKHKLQELNQKGKSKEGSDMDAFTVPETEVQNAKPVEVNNVDATHDNKEQEKLTTTVVTATPTPQPPATTPATTTTPPPTVENGNTEENVLETVEIRVEDEKVAEKNEKNTAEELKTQSEEKQEEPATIEETSPVIKKDPMELKYKYREDQWSPLNPEGKKHYDRNFLLQLQFAPECREKPDGLPKLPDVILDKPHSRDGMPSGLPRFGGMQGMKPGGMMPDFTPGFIKPSPSGKGSGMGGRSRSQTKKLGGVQDGRKVISITLQHEVKLHTSENAWKPSHKDAKPSDASVAKTEELYKQVRSILNKLAPQKFQTLVQQIMDLEIDTENRLKGTIDLVFEKAIDEPNFSVAYANMCKCMMPLKVPSENKPGEMVTFRALLLNRCQKEFEKDKANELDLIKMQNDIDAAPEEKRKELIEERDLAESKAKRRSLGNIRFIGELFKLRMLTEGIMHDCLFKLLRSNDEDSLECLCRLLTTIGKDIDHEKAKPRMNQYFMQMDKIVKQKRTSSRVRFMLQDVIELRASNWVPRREDNNPKTIDQINKEAQNEAMQKAAMIQNVQVPSKRGSRGGPRGGPGGPPTSEDGWQSVTKTSRNILDPSRMKITKQNVDENIQLGPGGRPGSFGSWGRGSSGGGKTSSQEAERPSAPANRFSALSDRSDAYGSGGRMGGRGLTPGRDSSKGRSSGLGGQRGGKAVARLSAEQDRDSALAAVRNIVSGQGGRSPMGSRNQSRENSRNRESRREREVRQAATAVPPVKELSEAEIEKKTKAIMDEFLHIQDVKEAIQCVRELESPKNIHFFVYSAVNHVLERSPQARKMTGTLFHDLIKQGIINVDIYLKGIKEVLEFAEDMEIDIPMIWKYLGEIMGPMVQDGSVPLGFLSAACEPLLRCNKAGILVAEILHEAVHRLGHMKVAEQWQASLLQWSSFLDPKEDVGEFLKKHKLEFTVGPPEPRSPEAQSMSASKMEVHLHRLLVEKKVPNEDIFDWIEANVGESRSKEPAFIRALMTAVCYSAISGSGTSTMKVETRQITDRLMVLQRYLDHQAELELQALYALQALVHKLEHPPGVLQTFFDTLYDEDIISEDAFNQWETSNDPAEQAGKGVARTSVTQFFTWLREAEEDGQEDN